MPTRLLSLLFLTAFLAIPHRVLGAGPDLSPLVLEQIQQMPRGGDYSIAPVASQRLREATRLAAGNLVVTPAVACPSYCSGATYLVFLKVLQQLRHQGVLKLEEPVWERLLVRGEPDGVGIWGRWNANGPGTARLFHELQLGKNFTSFEQARPGDFMKIFWSPEIGAAERGHSVIYLGCEGGNVRFWSSNKPGGYGEKAVPRAKIAFAIFSRLETPGNLAGAAKLPGADRYLAGLTSRRSSVAEAGQKCGF